MMHDCVIRIGLHRIRVSETVLAPKRLHGMVTYREDYANPTSICAWTLLDPGCGTPKIDDVDVRESRAFILPSVGEPYAPVRVPTLRSLMAIRIR